MHERSNRTTQAGLIIVTRHSVRPKCSWGHFIQYRAISDAMGFEEPVRGLPRRRSHRGDSIYQNCDTQGVSLGYGPPVKERSNGIARSMPPGLLRSTFAPDQEGPGSSLDPRASVSATCHPAIAISVHSTNVSLGQGEPEI